MSSPENSRAGTILDEKYELVRLLGQGGMGEVYEARHRRIGRRVARKFFHRRRRTQTSRRAS